MHEPSFGSTACVVTVPETAAPVSVSDQMTVVAPCESTPVPFHVPAKPIGCDEGEVGVAGEPAHEIAGTMRAVTETTTPKSSCVDIAFSSQQHVFAEG